MLRDLPLDAKVLIAKLHDVGSLIAQTIDPLKFKRAMGMLFVRLKAAREESDQWKLSKVIQRGVPGVLLRPDQE